MAAPVAGEADLPSHNFDLNLVNNDNIIPFDSAEDESEDDFTISKLAKSKPAPIMSSLGKRRKSKPLRYGVSPTVVVKTDSPLNPNGVVNEHSSKSLSSKKGTSATKSLKSPIEDLPAMIRAREVQSSLGTEHPSCIKLMLKTHVGGGYWMGFSQMFGKLYLPKFDTEMELEDENGEKYLIRYNAEKSGLSAGWKRFADGHTLLEGDVLVFHLVEPFKFKVYIIRVNDQNEVDGARSLINLEAHMQQMIPDNHTETEKNTNRIRLSLTTKKSKRPKSFGLTLARRKRKLSTSPSPIINHPNEHSGNDSEEVGSEVLEGSRPSKQVLSFQELKAFEDFRVMVKGQCIDSELPVEVRKNYYTLCFDRKEFLHDAIPDGLYYKLVAGMIGETVNIANEIKNSTLMTTKEEFEAWDNSLKSFALLGMKVGFLRDRIHALKRLAFESEGKLDIERYMEAKSENKRIEDEIKRLKDKIAELKVDSRKLQNVVDGLKEKAGWHEVKFQEEVNAPW